jgi:hypothetical protein
MKLKSFVKEFFVCMFLSIMADSIAISILGLDPDSNLPGHFMLLLYYWVIGNGVLIVALLLFSLYFVIIIYLVNNTNGWIFYLLMVLWAFVFVVSVTLDDWNLSPPLWSFGEYLSKGGHYSIYALVVAVFESVMGWKKKRNLLK